MISPQRVYRLVNLIMTTVTVHNLNDDRTDRANTSFACCVVAALFSRSDADAVILDKFF